MQSTLTFLLIQYFILYVHGFVSNHIYFTTEPEVCHAFKTTHPMLSPVTKKTNSTIIRPLEESDIFPLTRIMVQEWGPMGPSSSFSLFPKFFSKRFAIISFIENFCLAIVVTLGLYQRWNRKGFLSRDDYNVYVLLNQYDEVLGAAELSWQPKFQVSTPLALPLEFKHLIAGGRENMVPYISNLVVSKTHRRQGHGKKLIQLCEDQLRKKIDSPMSDSIFVYLHVSNQQDCNTKTWYIHKLGYEIVDNQNEIRNASLFYEWVQRLTLLLSGLYFMETPSLDYLQKEIHK